MDMESREDSARTEKALIIAKNLLAMNMPPEQVTTATGLTRTHRRGGDKPAVCVVRCFYRSDYYFGNFLSFFFFSAIFSFDKQYISCFRKHK
jgi:hypothetical protein